MALVVGSNLRMHEYSDGADQPMLPIMRDNDRDALNPALVIFDKPGMIFKGRDVFLTVELRSINQQANFAKLTDDGINLRPDLTEIVSF